MYSSEMKLKEDIGSLTHEELRQRISTLERHVSVDEQNYHERFDIFKKYPNDTNLAFVISYAETVIDRYSKLIDHYKEYASRLRSAR